MTVSKPLAIPIARCLIGVVIFFNLLAAALFLINPHQFTTAFELSGFPGVIMVRAMGILFVMWNVPYCFACWNPYRNRISLLEAILMQFIGLAGENWLLFTLGGDHQSLRQVAVRFILFDSAGLGFLLIAAWLSHPNQKQT